MKKLLTFLYCLLTIGVYAQEKLNKFHVIDSETKKAVPSVLITILRANLSITTEKDGVFIIPGNLEKMWDTVIFYKQSYALYKIALAKLNGMDTIPLNKFLSKAITPRLNYKDDTLLNNFNRREINYYTGLHTETELFNYLQMAQRFEVQKPGVALKNVAVSRLAFNVNYFSVKQYKYAELEHIRYRIHVYDTDPTTGGPGRDLCDETIEVQSSDTEQSTVNLKKYNIIIPGKTFFVAVEWLRDSYNMGYVAYYDKKQEKDIAYVSYRPTIGISPVTGKKLNIWGLTYKMEWKPYTHFAPFGTDLAIKATVEY